MVPTDSFFSFFSPPTPPSADDADDVSIASDLDEKLELDYQVGEDLKERVIPRAVDWFDGSALRHEQGAFGGDDSDEFDDEFDDDEDEDDRCAPVSPSTTECIRARTDEFSPRTCLPPR